MNIRNSGILIGLWLFIGSNSYAQNNWQLQKDDKGVKIYTRGIAGSNFKEIKLQTELHASLEAILAILSDKKNFPNWVYGCSEAGTLKVVNENQFYHYQVTNVQWPVQDRELIVHNTIVRHSDSKTVEIVSKAAPTFNKENGDRLRIKNFNATWKFVSKENGNVSAEYLVSMDPGGHTPAWLLNLFITEGPTQTIKKMKMLLPYYESKLVQLDK